MKKTIKKILTIACSLVLCLVCLTGCSWLDIDRYKYYNAVVVSVGDKDFYKKDLIEAFSNYGYQYYEQYGMSLEESVNNTIDSMVDRWLLLEAVKNDTSGKYDITVEEANKIKQQAFDYMRDSVYSYESKIRKEWGIEIEADEDSEEESESLRDAEETYTPSTVFDYVSKNISGTTTTVLEVTRNAQEEEEEEVILDADISDPSVHFDKSRLKVTDTRIADEAWTRYVKALQDSAKSEGRSTKESDVLLHEEQRLIDLLTNNLYLEKYEEEFYNQYVVDTDKVLEYYKNSYLAQKTKYESSISQYHTDMKDASSNYIYYNPISTGSGKEYVRVKHILINFNDLQKDQISQLKSDYGIEEDEDEETMKNSDDEIVKAKYEEYQKKLNAIVKQTTTTFDMKALSEIVDMGTVTSDTATWNAVNTGNGEYNVVDFVMDYVASAGSFEEKCARFNELVYIFNDDGGFMNSEFDYVVNLDTNVTDQMVKPFADGVRALDKSNDGEGEGSMDYIVSEYGIHIIFHAGNVKNLVEDESVFDRKEEFLKILCTNTTTPESNKSIFNYIYDKLDLESNAYDTMTSITVDTARTSLKKNGIVITYYTKNYKDLWD